MNYLFTFLSMQLNLIANVELLNETSIANGTDIGIVIVANFFLLLIVALVDIGIIYLTYRAVKGALEFLILLYCMFAEHHETKREIRLRLLHLSQLEESYYYSAVDLRQN